jgi:biotin carboxyl carrier protein
MNKESLLENTQGAARRRFPWAMLIVAVLFIIVPFLSWYGTWFGRPLSDAQIEQYLHDTNKPRHIQHALSQIAERITGGDGSVKQWYAQVAAMARHPVPEVRVVAAWTMGQDNSCQQFHDALLTLLQDENATVRHNAALSLVRFGDASGRAELVRMLGPWQLRTETSGTVTVLIKEGTACAQGAPVVRIKQLDGQVVEVRAPEAGYVEHLLVSSGAQVVSGDELAVLSPGVEQVWEALRALYLIGQPEDIPYVQRYTQDMPNMPDRIRKQAAMTTYAIRARAERQ